MEISMAEHIFVFVLTFILIFFVMLIIYFRKKRKGLLKEYFVIQVLIKRYRLNEHKLNYEKIGFILILVNSLIIATTGTIATALPVNYIGQLSIAFVMLMIFIYLSFSLIGKSFKRKEKKK